MKTIAALLPATALLLSTTALSDGVAARKARPLPGLTVVTSGSEQALKYGSTVLSRPFGAQLVDRISVVGSYGTKDRYFLVAGEGGSECPARYAIVTARGGQAPTISAPFGTCAPGASARLAGAELIVSMPDSPGGAVPVRYAYAQGAVRPLGADAAIAEAAAAPATTRCIGPDEAGTAPADFRVELDRSLPADYRKRSGLHRIDIAPDQLRALVAGLACLSAWPGADTKVPKAATALFASSRHGKASFAALDDIARTGDSDPALRANARAFGAQMHYYVDRREAF